MCEWFSLFIFLFYSHLKSIKTSKGLLTTIKFGACPIINKTTKQLKTSSWSDYCRMICTCILYRWIRKVNPFKFKLAATCSIKHSLFEIQMSVVIQKKLLHIGCTLNYGVSNDTKLFFSFCMCDFTLSSFKNDNEFRRAAINCMN